MKISGVKAIADLLKSTEKLQKLSIDFNELGLSGSKSLIKVLVEQER